MPEQPGVERLALSPMQKGMLYHHLTGGPADVDLQQILVTLPEALDIDRLRAAWERVVDRHPTLRSSFDWEDRGPPRRVVQPAVRLPFEVTDLESLDRVGREEGLADLIATRRSQAFQPGNAPLFSVDLVRFGADDFTLLWSFHHLIMDGHSTALVLEELFLVYEALAGDHEPALELVAPYSEFLDWLDARERSEDREYWTRALDTFDGATPLPGELGAAARPAPAGPPLEEEELRLGGEETTRLARFAEGLELTLNALIQAAWAVVLSRFSGATDVVYGVTRTARSRDLARSDAMVGVLIQTYPVRVEVEADRPVGQWLRGLKDAHRAMGDRFLTDLPAVQACSGVSPGAPLFQSLYMYDHQEMTTSLRGLGGAWARREVRILERPPYPMTLYAYGEPELRLRIVSDPGRIEPGTPSRLLDLLRHVLGELSRDAERPVRSALGLPDAEQARLVSLGSGTALRLEDQPLVHQQILARGAHHSDEIALVAGDRSTTYRELADSVRRCANGLRQRGVGPGMIVGLEGDRSIETVTCLLAVLETGAAYLPLDPSYPESRLRFMADDSGVSHIVIGPGAHMAWGDDFDTVPARELLTSDSAVTPAGGSVGARDLAYVIYTSGSTGRPKGVMVEHGNVRNFLAAMDEAVSQGTPKTWLSVTPLSFDISVLELLWTLSRGWRVALPTPGPGPGAADVTPMTDPSRAEARSAGSASASIGRKADTAFGLFFFAAASGEQAGDGYRLLLEGARKADALGFASIWTPERHFHEFGGLYPNPSVTGAALAAITRNLAIRAGSVVLPLHDPIRVAEEWSLVDNVSGGRAGVAFASGWQRNDFVLAPDNYHNRHEEMYRAIEIVQRLWRGEEVNVPGVDGEQVGVRLYPRPVQPMLPMWLTAAGSPETFRKAGEIGAGVLTHLLGQSVEDLAELLDTYREARRTAGHRPGHGHVTVMLHAFVGEDDEEVRDLVRTPLREYLRSSVSLIKNYSGVWASRKGDGGAQAEGDEFEKLPPADLEAILDQAFERYYETSGLLGPADKCADLVQRLATVGVNEIACLVDFGVATDLALDGIDNIAALGRMLSPAASAMTQHTVRPAGLATADRGEAGQTETESEAPRPADAMMDVPGLIGRHDVTHMQCTPSLLRMLLADADGRTALAALDVLLVGGGGVPRHTGSGGCRDHRRTHREYVRTDRDHRVVGHGTGRWRRWRNRPDRAPRREHPALRARLRRCSVAERVARRVVHRGGRRGARLLRPARPDRSALRSRSILGRDGRPHVPHRRSGALAPRRCARVSRSHGPASKAPWSSRGARRDRSRAAAAPWRGARRRRPPGRRVRWGTGRVLRPQRRGSGCGRAQNLARGAAARCHDSLALGVAGRASAHPEWEDRPQRAPRGGRRSPRAPHRGGHGRRPGRDLVRGSRGRRRRSRRRLLRVGWEFSVDDPGRVPDPKGIRSRAAPSHVLPGTYRRPARGKDRGGDARSGRRE